MSHIECEGVPEGAMILRRSTVTVYLDPETGEPEMHLDLDDGTDREDQTVDTNSVIGDLEAAKLWIWEDSRGG
ncbi:hypothetical protein SEA_ANARQUE_74 [Gordonia phage AnarQue]|nr:hypothetical protein SEA_ANARQUE_74 [Gordonia phage AnarQue]